MVNNMLHKYFTNPTFRFVVNFTGLLFLGLVFKGFGYTK